MSFFCVLSRSGDDGGERESVGIYMCSLSRWMGAKKEESRGRLFGGNGVRTVREWVRVLNSVGAIREVVCLFGYMHE